MLLFPAMPGGLDARLCLCHALSKQKDFSRSQAITFTAKANVSEMVQDGRCNYRPLRGIDIRPIELQQYDLECS